MIVTVTVLSPSESASAPLTETVASGSFAKAITVTLVVSPLTIIVSSTFTDLPFTLIEPSDLSDDLATFTVKV